MGGNWIDMNKEAVSSPWTVDRAVDYIHAARDHRGKNGLSNMVRLCARLGNPERALRAVHVAGTNGKGSTCACIDAMLRAAGYRVGLYTSPFLQHYTERIRLDGEPLGDAAFLAAFALVHAAVEALHAEDVWATPFEMGTAMAFLAFAQADVDVCVIEVGLGGRLDPTNVLTPLVCAITAIGLDHQALLGDTLTAIAAEKAGIIKPGVPVVIAAQSVPEIGEVFAARAAELGTPLYPLTGDELTPLPFDASLRLSAQRAAFAYGDWTLEQVWLRLPGAHQLRNAATALAVIARLREIGLPIPDEAVVAGLSGVRWPGRLEWFPRKGDRPGVLLDGAHNAHGALALAEFVRSLPANVGEAVNHAEAANGAETPARVLLCGMLSEKLSENMLDALSGLAPRAFIVAPHDRRAIPPEQLAGKLAERGVEALPCGDVASAFAQACRAATPEGMVIAAGSLYLVGELRALLTAARLAPEDSRAEGDTSDGQ